MITKKHVLLLIGIIVASILLYALWWLFSAGNLSIEANKDTELRIQPLSSTNSEIIEYKGPLSRRLKNGEYLINATNATSQYEKVIKISGNQTTMIKIPYTEIKQGQMLANIKARSINLTSDKIQYVDNDSNYLMSLTKNNIDPVSYGSEPGEIYFSDWANSHHGIFLGDIKGKTVLSVFSNGKIKTFNSLGFEVKTAAIAPNGKFIVSSGNNIYLFDSINSTPKILFTSEIPDPILSISNKRILISSVESSSHKEISTKNPQMLMYGIDGKRLSTKNEAYIDAVFNPSSNLAVITSVDSAYLADSDLNVIHKMPPGIKYAYWVNDSVLAYVKGSEVWMYDLAKSYSYQLTKTGLDIPITSISISDSSVIYSTSDDDMPAVYSIDLSNDSKTNPKTLELMKVLPLYEDGFRVELNTFGTIKIVIRAPESPNQDYVISKRNDGLQALKETGIDISGIPIHYSSLQEY